MFRGLLFLFGCWLIISNCNVFEDDLDAQDIAIEFQITVYGLPYIYRDTLLISETGFAEITSINPELQQQLTNKQFRDLKKLLFGYENMDREFFGNCGEGAFYDIIITESEKTTLFETDECAFIFDEIESNDIIKLELIVDKLNEIYRHVYDNQVPWRDLILEYSFNKDRYDLGEEIIADYIIRNPTNEVRELWLKSDEIFFFDAYANDQSYRYSCEYFDPPRNTRFGTHTPRILTIPPNEELVFQYTWDQQYQSCDPEFGGFRDRFRIYTQFNTDEFHYESHLIYLNLPEN